MKSKATLAAGITLLLAGIIAAYLTTRDPKAGSGQSSTPAPTSGADAQKPGSGEDAKPAQGSASRTRNRDEMKHKDLVEKYGESRTKLAAAVSGNVVAVLEDVIDIGEKALTGPQNGPFGSRNGLRMALGGVGNQLNLTEEQQAKATAAYQAFQRRELDKSKAAIGKLKQDPSSLMRLMLASDASSKGDITDEEYQQLQTDSAKDLTGIVNPLEEKNFRGGKPLRDEAFVSELKATLDPTQAQTLDAELAKQAAEPAPNPNEGNISTIPKMGLEKLDQTITSVRKMTVGFKSLIEGMGGLQDLRPPAEPDKGGE
ncbi:MAG: hypothetical protein J0M04_07785 [Verrucomicrobia bacterium]|nr:hypothetical protein [Verrucomicrobiota bacterium]